MGTSSGLTVRQFERETLNLSMEFVIEEAHREQVRFSAMSSAVDASHTRGQVHDISSGGVGFVCPHFLPRMCEGTIRIFNPVATGTARDGSSIHDMVFEHRVKVRRVILESHEPSYSIGAAFVNPSSDIDERVTQLLAMLTGSVGSSGGEHA